MVRVLAVAMMIADGVHVPRPYEGSKSHLEARLEALVPGAQVLGVAGTGPVTVVHTQWVGTLAITLTYRDVHGRTNQVILGRDREPCLTVVATGDGPRFDADPEFWRLAAEALRIHNAALFDPMLAIASSSDLQPLPHQIHAVYGELLPRTPLSSSSRATPVPARPSWPGYTSRNSSFGATSPDA
jgi:hypothetical protein